MAQRSHVPRFGNWESDDVPYTAYFENARKEKAGGVRMNPNDPEENPDAFMFGGTDDLIHSYPANSVETNLDKLRVGEKHQNGQKQHRAHQRNPSDQQKSISKSMTASETGSEKSNSARSTPHLHKRSDGRKSSESSNGFTRPKGGRNPSDDLSSRSASVPKFGEWDERDPKSGEGFTVIFNKVKEEKQIAASKFPPVQPDTSKYRDTQRNEPRNKMFCCLF